MILFHIFLLLQAHTLFALDHVSVKGDALINNRTQDHVKVNGIWQCTNLTRISTTLLTYSIKYYGTTGSHEEHSR